jgi:hypothetical protein
MLQDIAERSRQKSDMLQGFGDTVLRAEALEEQLVKSRKHSIAMQSKLDTAFAKYHRNKNKGTRPPCRVLVDGSLR